MSREPHAVSLPRGHTWWRVADLAWTDPLDPTWADRVGGRWNAPGDGPTLYLNADLATAWAQLPRLLAGSSIDVEDLRDDAPYIVVPVRLPDRQHVADATTDTGLAALGLPQSYPRGRGGAEVSWRSCRRAAGEVRAARLRGVLARSAASADGSGRELAWFPARGSSASTGGPAQGIGDWRHAVLARD